MDKVDEINTCNIHEISKDKVKIPCPEGKEGCAVAHYKVVCAICGKIEEIRVKYRKRGIVLGACTSRDLLKIAFDIDMLFSEIDRLKALNKKAEASLSLADECVG